MTDNKQLIVMSAIGSITSGFLILIAILLNYLSESFFFPFAVVSGAFGIAFFPIFVAWFIFGLIWGGMELVWPLAVSIPCQLGYHKCIPFNNYYGESSGYTCTRCRLVKTANNQNQ
jgi:hypothetical protein